MTGCTNGKNFIRSVNGAKRAFLWLPSLPGATLSPRLGSRPLALTTVLGPSQENYVLKINPRRSLPLSQTAKERFSFSSLHIFPHKQISMPMFLDQRCLNPLDQDKPAGLAEAKPVIGEWDAPSMPVVKIPAKGSRTVSPFWIAPIAKSSSKIRTMRPRDILAGCW